MGIFNFFRSEPDHDLILSQKERIQERLCAIKKLLSDNDYPGKARVIESLLSLLRKGEIIEFIREIQSVNMWGGAGAVWEVWFGNDKAQIQFAREMLSLIINLERIKISNRRITSFKKLFRKLAN